MKRIKLAVISHALVQDVCQKRWKVLAEHYPVDVALIVPAVWRSRWFGREVVFRQRLIKRGHFNVRPYPTTTTRYWGKYLFRSLDVGLRDIRPDVIYVIQEEMLWIHQQMIFLRQRDAPQARMLFFSMNALGVSQRRWDQRWRWNRVRKNYDAALCHYPGGLKSLKDAGFDKPVFIQTQIGVDEELYKPVDDLRASMRRHLGIQDSFVIGYAGRLTRDKGLDILLEAVTSISGRWKLLLIGNGDYRQEIQDFFKKRGWANRVIFVDAVGQGDVAPYLRAMDCFVIGSRTRPFWVDTFPNALVQAMACGVPAIGSDSGAIPFIMQDAGTVVPEGRPVDLAEALRDYMQNDQKRKKAAQKARERAVQLAGMQALSRDFYDILGQVMTGDFRKDLENHDARKAWTGSAI